MKNKVNISTNVDSSLFFIPIISITYHGIMTMNTAIFFSPRYFLHVIMWVLRCEWNQSQVCMPNIIFSGKENSSLPVPYRTIPRRENCSFLYSTIPYRTRYSTILVQNIIRYVRTYIKLSIGDACTANDHDKYPYLRTYVSVCMFWFFDPFVFHYFGLMSRHKINRYSAKSPNRKIENF